MFKQAKKTNKIIFIIFILSLVGCGKSHKLTSYGKPFKRYKVKAELGFSTISFLFVLDTSGSMGTYHKQMVGNLKVILPIVKENPKYDYNFAVTTMSPGYNFSKNQPPLFLAHQGILKKCIDSDKDNLNNIIRQTDVGSYFNYSGSNTSFETISCLLSENINSLASNIDNSPSKPAKVTSYYYDDDERYFESLDYIMENADADLQKNFFGKDVFLGIIFVSDASGFQAEHKYNLLTSDLTITEEKIDTAGRLFGTKKFKALRKFKGDDQVKAYGVIPRKNWSGKACGEGGSGLAHILSFIDELGGKYFSICDGDNWGENLKVIKEDLKNSINLSSFLLDELPLVDTIKVFFNGYSLPNNIEAGWYYNPETVSIHVGHKFNYKDIGKKRTTNDKYVIEYQPMNLELLYRKAK